MSYPDSVDRVVQRFFASVGLVLLSSTILSTLTSSPASAGWLPSCAGCAETDDAMGGAAESFNHNYGTLPGAVLDGGGSYLYDPFGHVGTAIIHGHATGLPDLVGSASAHCATGQFMSMSGCTTGPSAPQGKTNCPTSAGDPINLVSGNHFEEVDDFATQGGDKFALTRYYNSDQTYVIQTPAAYNDYTTPNNSISPNAPNTSRFGNSWRSQYDLFIFGIFGLSSSASQIDAIRTDGNPVHFAKSGSTWYVAYWDASTQSWSSTSGARHDVDLRISTDGTYWYIQDELDTIEKYDQTGKLLQIAYRGGYTLTLTYNSIGENTVVTDSFGKTLTFTYLANGLVDTVTDPTTGVTHYSYVNQSGYGSGPTAGSFAMTWALQQVTYPDGKSLTYLYEDTNPINRYALTGITDENGNRFATWTYDSTTGRTLSSYQGNTLNANFTSISYDDVADTRTVTNALGKQAVYNLSAFQDSSQASSIDGQASTHCPASTVSFLYDTNGYVSKTTSGEGRINTYAYNSIGQETSRTEGFGTSVARTIMTDWNITWREPDKITAPNVTTDFTYDTSGRLKTFTLTDTTTTSVPYSTNGQTRTWTYDYYTNGLLNTVDGPLSGTGDTTTYAYDSNGFVNSITDVLGHTTTVSSNNGWGEPLTSVDANSITTNYTYDLRGRLKSVTINPGASQALYRFDYDDAGNLTVVTLPDSSTLTYAYDDAHRVTSVTNNSGEKLVYTLDALGDRTQTDVKNSGGTIVKTQSATFDELGRMLTSIGAASQTTQYTYDKDSNQISMTDPRSKLYGFAFDALNRLYQQTDPDSYTTTTAFNAQDGVLSVTDARSLATSYVRDGFGDVIRQSSPDTGITDFWYDNNGAVVKKIDARSVETDYTNDNAGRVLTKTFPAASSENVTYGYDSTTSGNKGVGMLTSLTDQSGSAAFVYDSLGHVTSITKVIGANSYSLTYTYDAAGHVLTMTYPSGRIVTYTRDALGRISTITTKQNSGATAVNVTTSITYKPFGPLAGLTFGNGVVLGNTYDQDYQLTDISAANGGTTIQDLTNGFDASSNITSVTDHLASGRTQTVTYDDLNRVGTASGAYGSQSYTYDGVGNRLTRVMGSTTDTYAYSSTANRVSTITTSSNVRTFSYLASGQVSQDVRDSSNTYAFTANNNGRNASASLNGSTAGSYLYDAFEQRVQKTAGGVTTQLIYDQNGHLIGEASSSGVAQKEYIWLDDLPVAMLDDTGTSPVLYLIHTDQLGTPQKITDSTMNVVWDGVFDPFGNPVAGLGSASWGSVNWGSFNWSALTNLRFPGQYFDTETVLHQNWNRDYDSTLGRYVQSDPIGVANGINTYIYADGSPLSRIDPFGLWQVTISGGNGIFGGSVTFGSNGGQTNAGGYLGSGGGFSVTLDTTNSGCKAPGPHIGFKSSIGGGFGFANVGASGSVDFLQPSVGVGLNLSLRGPGSSLGGGGELTANLTNTSSRATDKITLGGSYFGGWGGQVYSGGQCACNS